MYVTYPARVDVIRPPRLHYVVHYAHKLGENFFFL